MKNYGPGLPKCCKCKNIHKHILHTFQGVYSPTFTPNSLQELVHILIQVLSAPKPKSHACNNGSPPNKQTKKHLIFSTINTLMVHFYLKHRPYKVNSNKMHSFMDFPRGPVVKTPCSQCRGPRFHPWVGN